MQAEAKTQIETKVYRSKTLDSKNWPRRPFNAKSAEDLTEYRYFLQHQRWKNGCPFLIEWPFNNAVSMVEHKILRQHLDGLIRLSKGTKVSVR